MKCRKYTGGTESNLLSFEGPLNLWSKSAGGTVVVSNIVGDRLSGGNEIGMALQVGACARMFA